MTRKLIATLFTYGTVDQHGQMRHESGSYLGRKPASKSTLRRFSQGNLKGSTLRLTYLEPGESFESQWIAK